MKPLKNPPDVVAWLNLVLLGRGLGGENGHTSAWTTAKINLGRVPDAHKSNDPKSSDFLDGKMSKHR